MKRIFMLFTVLLLFVPAGCSAPEAVQTEKSTNNTAVTQTFGGAATAFSIDDDPCYKAMINSFSSTVYFGKINGPADAVTAAEKMWTDNYGIEKALTGKPYRIFYDEGNDIWMLKDAEPETLSTDTVRAGGDINILIKGGTGEILAMWAGK